MEEGSFIYGTTINEEEADVGWGWFDLIWFKLLSLFQLMVNWWFGLVGWIRYALMKGIDA